MYYFKMGALNMNVSILLVIKIMRSYEVNFKLSDSLKVCHSGHDNRHSCCLLT